MEDKTLVCQDCGAEFVFTVGEQEFYKEKGFDNEPKRCKECRAKRKQSTRRPRNEFQDCLKWNLRSLRGSFLMKNIVKDDILFMDKHYVYILKCKDNSLYTGWTTDIEKRLKAHNSGKGAKYTKSRKPVVLVYKEEFDSKSDALRREAAIKKLTREQKLELINKHQRGMQNG